AAALPADIAGLSRRQYVSLRRRQMMEDLARLLTRLTRLEPRLVTHRTAKGALPRQLPAAPHYFVGPAQELDLPDALARQARRGETAAAAVIGGTAGVGKTALALPWAHRARRRFPDGDLYADLRGYGPGGSVDPGTVLTGFLRAPGVNGRDIPPDLTQRSAQLRTLLDSRSMLIVLDNARSDEQVRPLLPASASCLVLVTS